MTEKPNTNSTVTVHTGANVTAGVRHVHRVKAINAAGAGPRSNCVRATTQDETLGSKQ